MSECFSIYKRKHDRFSARYVHLNKQIDLISKLRLLVFLCFGSLGFYLFDHGTGRWFLASLAVGIVLFIILVIKHSDVIRLREYIERLVHINSRGLDRLQNNWRVFANDGHEFIDPRHPFTSDLDIFGPNSIYQWINAAHTIIGKGKLAHYLKDSAPGMLIVKRRQNAVDELAEKIEWRQAFEAEAWRLEKEKNPEILFSWAEDPGTVVSNSICRFSLRFLPAVSLVISICSVFLWKLYSMPVILCAIHLLIVGFMQGKTKRTISRFEKCGAQLMTYYELIRVIESETFNASLLIELQELMQGRGGRSPSICLKKFARIVEASDIRHSGMLIVALNMLFMWDVQCLLAAESWRVFNGSHIRDWCSVIGEFEALASLSVIRFEHPDWCFPTFLETNQLSAGKLGHPLLSDDERVCNDVTLNETGKIGIITGSNMSGKSTFLRTIGVNLVLAYAGAPVCAYEMKCSFMKIFTLMRIGDNLLNKVSTFYAELLRIKMIVNAINGPNEVLFLIDEIFRGTNSRDRYDGAVVVLNALASGNAKGFISTHDLDLCKLAESGDKRFQNFHFDEYYSEQGIKFPYKLKIGPSTTRNAIYLIKMLGILPTCGTAF